MSCARLPLARLLLLLIPTEPALCLGSLVFLRAELGREDRGGGQAGFDSQGSSMVSILRFALSDSGNELGGCLLGCLSVVPGDLVASHCSSQVT